MSSKRRIHALLKTRTSELPGDPTLQIKRVPGRFNTGLQKVAPTYRRVNAPDIPATESGAQTQKVRATAIMCPLLRGSLNRYPRPTLPPPPQIADQVPSRNLEAQQRTVAGNVLVKRPSMRSWRTGGCSTSAPVNYTPCIAGNRAPQYWSICPEEGDTSAKITITRLDGALHNKQKGANILA